MVTRDNFNSTCRLDKQ